MLASVLALAVAAGAPAPATSAGPSVDATSAIVASLAGRPEARIPFARSISGFRAAREDGEDVVYIEVGINRWYRAELSCFGIDDVRSAHALVPLDRGFGVDRFSRLAFFGLGDRHPTECRVTRLVELSRDEAVGLKLARPKRS